MVPIARRSADEVQTLVDSLPPARRLLLRPLLLGLNNKEIAAEVGRTPAAVKQQLGAVFEHFGVDGRVALAALLVRHIPDLADLPSVDLTPPDPPLRPSQQRILALLSEGLSRPRIARRMWLAYDTVCSHLSAVHLALGVHSSVAAVIRYQRLLAAGVVQPAKAPRSAAVAVPAQRRPASGRAGSLGRAAS